MPARLLLALAAGYAGYKVWKSGQPKKVFFSFHYADIFRVQKVKNSWLTHPDHKAAGFFDYSLEEAAKSHSDEEIEALIDDALEGTEATAILIGGQTWRRRWVRYEIEESALRGNALLGIYIHGLRDQRHRKGLAGKNPLDMIEYDEYGSTLSEFVETYDWVAEDGYRNFGEWLREAPTLRDAP